MKPDVQEFLMKHRKAVRNLIELRKARDRVSQLKQPDAKLLKAIDEDIAELEKSIK